MSELFGGGLAGGESGAAATCEGTTTVSLVGEGALVGCTSGAGADDGMTAGGGRVASDMRTSLLVPNAVDAATCGVGRGTIADCPSGEVNAGGAGGDGGGGGCWDAGGLAAGCVRGGCSAVVEVVDSMGAAAVGVAVGVEVGVVAVRAWERVHRLPFTVVIDSCGVAIQAAQS